MRLFPSPCPIKETSINLSILDATVARFSNTSAIWIFDAPRSNDRQLSTTTLIKQLRSSFITTLASFPHWAGQLQWAHFRPGGSHQERFNRLIIKYGSHFDPGVDWVLANQSYPVSSLVPLSPVERALSNDGIWMATGFPQRDLLSDTLLALHNLSDYEGLPSMSVQVNTFTCGGYAVAVKMAHPLADAQSLMVFMHLWAATSRGQALGHPIKSPMDVPVFDPSLLDSHAAGDIDAPATDPDLTSSARDLPLHRFDWWDASAPDMFKSETEATKPSESYLSTVIPSPSCAPPWNTWDMFLPVEHAQLHFNKEELAQIQTSARTALNGRPELSRLDALLAHIWSLINRARGLAESQENVFLNVTIGARTRVSPPLPKSFIGSPLFLAHVRTSGSTASDASSLGANATAVRETISLFTPEKMGAILHDAAHEVSPQRLWQGFLGKYHTLVTSWMRLGVYDVDFEGGGGRPRYVHAVMPKMDGIVQVMDSGSGEDGIDVTLYLEKEAMGRFLDDGLLRSFKH